MTLEPPVRYISLCSGIEAASVGWGPLGWTPLAFAEIDPFCCAILRHRFPAIPNLGDLTRITPAALRALGDCHVLIAGTPCQSFSLAGLRKGLNDDRGNLTLAFSRLACSLNLPFTVWGNVPGVLSDGTNAFGCLLAGLIGERVPVQPGHRNWSRAGVAVGPEGVVAWRVLDAQHFGVPQRRHRLFVVRCPRHGADPREILLERAGVRWHPPQSGKAGQNVAYSLDRGARCIGAKEQQRTLIVCRAVLAGWAKCTGGPSGDEWGNLTLDSGRVRRLTPRECERLQGFPDDWTAPTGREPDTRRYKAIGNSMAVPVIRWLGRRIDGAIHAADTAGAAPAGACR